MLKFISPLSVMKSRAKKFILNLNQYRNTHYKVLNKCKITYKEIMAPQILRSPPKRRVICVYTVYPGTLRHYDLGNVCSVHEKFFEDAFTELGKLEDDNTKFIPLVLYRVGELDREKPRVEIELIDLSDDGIRRLKELIDETYNKVK